MKAKISILFLLSFVFYIGASQVPQGFNYQAIARDGTGHPISDPIDVKIAILAADNSTVIYEEQHSGVDPNDDGLFSIVVGNGSRIAGLANFNLIDWTVSPKFIRTKIVYNGEKDLGSTKLNSVPYALVADSLGGPLNKLSVVGTTTNMEEALFEVRNTSGKTVFAVYNEGVRVYVGDGNAKGSKGGFAVSSMVGAKAVAPNYLYVSRDSIRAYVFDDPLNKGVKGGFAVSGYNDAKKQTNDFLLISPDSVRVLIDPSPSTGKGVKGGFAVTSFGDSKAPADEYLRVTADSTRVYVNPSPAKELKGGFAVGSFGIDKGGPVQKLLTVSEDSIRMYINDGAAGKGAKGGFAVSGFDQAKGGANTNFMTIATDNTGIINPAENRILWYPMNDKNAFLVGRVLIHKPDSIGVNSVTTGYESRAKGAQSQAMGYKSIARGDYSTAIGKNAIAHKDNSFSFGELTKAFALNSYAFGYSSTAKGQYSFAFGQGSLALSAGSYAFGKTATANGQNSFAFGESVTAGLNNTITNAYAFGKSPQAQANNSFAFGNGAIAYSNGGFAFGKTAIANGVNSFAFGENVTAGLTTSVTNAYAFGLNAQAKANYSFAMGENVIAQNANSYSFGRGSQATADDAVAMGRNSSASGARSFAIGGIAQGADSKSFGGIATGIYSFTSGESPEATGASSVAMGTLATASGANSFAIGYRVKAAGNQSFALGMGDFLWNPPSPPTEFFTEANGTASFAMGQVAHALENGSVAIGTRTTSSGLSAYALGFHTTAQAAFSTVVGSYGIASGDIYSWVGTDPLFVIGNGDPNVATNSNAVTVLKNGNMRIGTGDFSWALNVEKIQADGYVAQFNNRGGATTSNGVFIGAGHASTSTGAKFLTFARPSGKTLFAEIGSITQSGTGASVAYNTTSDARIKTNIIDTHFGISDLMKVQVRDFEFIEDYSGQINTGFIAQELYETYPLAVTKPVDNRSLWQIDYGKVTPLIVKSVQDQQYMIESLTYENTQLKSELQSLKNEIAQIKTMLSAGNNY